MVIAINNYEERKVNNYNKVNITLKIHFKTYYVCSEELLDYGQKTIQYIWREVY